LTPLRDIEVIGDMILARLAFASAIARGALFGVGANGAGTARPPDRRDGRRGGRSQPCPRLYTLANRHRRSSDSQAEHIFEQGQHFRYWPVASFRCAVEFGRYQGRADSDNPSTQQIYGFTA
jgi:hypothetical protein